MTKINNNNAVPVMTSNNSPSGAASATSIYSKAFDAYQAFDSKNTTSWATDSVKSGILSYMFESSLVIKDYKITGPGVKLAVSWSTRGPSDWTFEGSKNGSDWDVLDTQTGIVWADTETKEFETNNLASYSYYRLNITNNVGGSGVLQIVEFSMFKIELEIKGVVKNPITTKLYSLSDKMLVVLPNNSNKNIILYGIEVDEEIQLDVPFTKIGYIEKPHSTNGDVKIFKRKIDVTKFNSIGVEHK